MSVLNIKSRHELYHKQIEFVQSDLRYNLFSGGVRSGKTLALIYRALRCALEGRAGIIATKNYRMLKDIVMKEFIGVLSVLNKGVWGHNKSDAIFTFSTGGQIYLRHLQDVPSIKGPTWGFICIDEGTDCLTLDLFSQLDARLSLSGATMAIATNPGTKNHFLYDFFYRNQSDNKLVIDATPYDNPFLNDDYIAVLEASPPGWKRNYLLGEWGVTESLVYSEFDLHKHVAGEPPEPVKEWFLAIDWGHEHPFVCLLVGLTDKGRIWVEKELYVKKGKPEQLVNEIKTYLIDDKSINFFVADPSQPMMVNYFAEKLDILSISPPRKYRSDTVSSRISGINLVKQALWKMIDGFPMAMVNRTCTNLLNEWGLYERKIDTNGNISEEPKKENDDGLDSLRYLVTVLYVQSYIFGESN